jgi:Methyltransferase domain
MITLEKPKKSRLPESKRVKNTLKRLAARFAGWQPIRSAVIHLVYPNIVRALFQEVQADIESPSGLVETWGWKIHSLIIRSEELAGGKNCVTENSAYDFETRRHILDVVMRTIADIPGDICEFGVAAGDSFLEFLERAPERQVYGFDSFEGLPEDWWTRPRGSFASPPPQVLRLNAHVIKGWFDHTVPEFFSQWTGRIALLHIDCDLYSSTKVVFRHSLEYCAPGTVVLFDEFYNYPGFEGHEWRAWNEAKADHNVRAECVAYDGRRAAFRITGIR